MPAQKLTRQASVLFRWYVHRGLRTTMPVARRRLATGLGAIVLAAFALAFAKSADVAQLAFARLFARAPLLPLLLTPLIFAGVAFATRRWASEARGSGIPQIIAAAQTPDAGARRLASFKVAVSKVVLTLLMLLGGASVGREGPTYRSALRSWSGFTGC